MTETWAGRGDTLLCVAIRDETADVKTFVFRAASGRRFAFHPGQYVTLETGSGARCFTIASPPTRPDAIELTIKAQAPGGATRWLHAHMAPGATIQARRPAGDFCIDQIPEEGLALLSAGSGATPMIAMLRWLDDLGIDHPVQYLHVARTEADLLFRAEVEAIAARRPGLAVHWLITGPPGRRPDAGVIGALLPDLAARRVFACGPAGFRASAQSAHRAAGGGDAWFHQESFAAPPPDDVSAPAGPQHWVRVLPRDVVVAAGADEPLLAALARAGIIVPSSCRQGICATCRIRRLSGPVDMRQQGGLFDDEVEAGDILACCSFARGPLEIEISA